jgi:GntR family transcriptional regulator, transcriptional repressor for pyruvate dehydrogenase complex
MSASPAPRAWQVVLAHVEDQLRDGRLAPGERLAPERELAAHLGVGRSSVREALRVLEVFGVIRTATGSGPTAGAIVVAAPRGGLSTLLRLQVAASGFPAEDVVRTRLVLEAAAVEALASVEDRDTAVAHQLLDAMDASELDASDFLALDAQLHLSLVEASGNVVAAAMMEGLRDAIESYVRSGAAALDWDVVVDRLRAEHRAIVDAVDAGDPARARALVREHITRYYGETGLARPDEGASAW